MLRAVLDTNIIVSAAISSKGAPFDILEAWRTQRRFMLVTSPQILGEVLRVFEYPKIKKSYGLTDKTIERVILPLAKYAAVTPGELTVKEVKDDPTDDMFLACAIEGEADFIVSGDRHLLEIGTYRGVPILTAAAFLETLERRMGSSKEA
jgi:putative PIN family toxin of toxin-antitoxin system